MVAFPHFLLNTHKLWQFSDSSFHETCYERWVHKKEFEGLFSQYQKIVHSRPKIPKGMDLKDFEKSEEFILYSIKMKNFFDKQELPN